MQQIEIDRRDLIRYGGTGLATAAILGVLLWVGFALLSTRSPADKAFDEMRRLPMMAVVMADHSGVEGRMRKAIEEEIRKPTVAGGLSRPYALIGDLRQQ